jgi:Fe-S cluster assembly protein SufD
MLLDVGFTAAEIARAGRFSRHLFSIGSAVSRDVVHARLSGEGAECALDGLFMTEGDQRADLVTIVDHAVPHGTSRQTYKGVLDGRSRGAFTGRVIVRPDAQKTDAQQSNKNLLLSREALVNSTPALEIRANDVKCKHGSTTGQLDENALFYLRSRGLSEEESRTLLTYAFAGELVRRCPRARSGDIDVALTNARAGPNSRARPMSESVIASCGPPPAWRGDPARFPVSTRAHGKPSLFETRRRRRSRAP